MSQYDTAQEKPPHLKAIAPWEAAGDQYRGMILPGCIPQPEFEGMENGWKTTPRVRMALLDFNGPSIEDRAEAEYPLACTAYKPFYFEPVMAA